MMLRCPFCLSDVDTDVAMKLHFVIRSVEGAPRERRDMLDELVFTGLLCYCPRHSPTKTICSCLALYSPFTTGSAAEYESFLMVFACYFRKLTILLVCSGFWVLYTVLDMVGGMREGCGYRSTVLLPEVLTLNKSDMKYSRCYLL